MRYKYKESKTSEEINPILEDITKFIEQFKDEEYYVVMGKKEV